MRKKENGNPGMPIQKSDKIFVAGHRGMVGSALTRALEAGGFANVIKRDRSELDLGDAAAVTKFFVKEKPEIVIFAAARVGGIKANNDYPVEFLLENLPVQNNVIAAAYENGARKLLFLGSSCIYPKLAPQPIPESALLTGPLEPTNEAYAIAKIAGVKLCQAFSHEYGANFISAMPTNLYGPNDNFDLETSHVLAALLRKFHEAKIQRAGNVVIWGTGAPRREFMHVDDMADACVHLMRVYEDPTIMNIGVGEDIRIRELAELIARIVGYSGSIVYDETKPDGTPRKLLDISRLKSQGWAPRIPLEEGIRRTYQWYVNTVTERADPVGGRVHDHHA